MAIPFAMASLFKHGLDLVTHRWPAGLARHQEAVPAATVIPLRKAADAGSIGRGTSPCPQEEALICEFLDQDYAAAGRDTALRERNEEANARAVQALRARFDNILACVASRYAEHGYALERLRVDLRDNEQSDPPTDVIRLARLGIAQNKARIEELQAQRLLAREDGGWFGAVVASFAAGFQRGLREALDVEHLFR